MPNTLRATLFLSLCLSAACDAGATGSGGLLSNQGPAQPSEADGGSPERNSYYVSGRHLYDPCGEQVVLRGVNEMVIWSPGRDGSPEFSEIAKTGANAVRIVWNETGTAAQLDVAISNAMAAQLLPMVEHHSATGDLSKVPSVVDYWVRDDVVTVLAKHRMHLLLNIANEAGDGTVTADAFIETYATAIERVRATGLQVPLVIDAPSWGQDIDMLQATFATLTAGDPLHNLLFSVHMWSCP
jgi:mannan endo-1,4-beta-mannosidase